MPAAAVIPAPVAYIKVVAVKKFVVDFFLLRHVAPTVFHILSADSVHLLTCYAEGLVHRTLSESACSTQAIARTIYHSITRV